MPSHASPGAITARARFLKETYADRELLIGAVWAAILNGLWLEVAGLISRWGIAALTPSTALNLNSCFR